ncbi:MAG: NAD(P)H-hydrate dehydratase [Dehalococcoidales bacterium]|nr:NAD(P)H-hydrate dehydratase [Dehalococcoidales bacterium]
MKLVTVSEMLAIQRESGLRGVPPARLMENAGRALAEKVTALAGGVERKSLIILVGPGNNGGDGLVAARHLSGQGAAVRLVIPVKNSTNEANLRLAVEFGCVEMSSPQELEAQLKSADICMDGFFGTGRSRPIDGDFKAVLKAVNCAKKRNPSLLTIAIDLPSGLDGDTGALDPAVFIADHTLTLGYPKTGLFSRDDSIPVIGKITVLDIGIPPVEVPESGIQIIDTKMAHGVIPRRPANAHKGTSGKLMVIAGSANYPGAALLSSAGAARSGAGLVTLAVPRSLQATVVSNLPEVTYIPLEESSPGNVSKQAGKKIIQNMEGYNAILLGCGLGQTQESSELVKSVLNQAKKSNTSVVLDADALNLLAASSEWAETLPSRCILTPHPGEMERLSGLSVSQVQSERIEISRKKAAEWNQVVVLKGAYTVISSPDGRTMVNNCLNPALASAGTGDVLAGIIAGLLAQGLEVFEAGWLGVYLHSLAGIEASRERGPQGVLASDLLPLLPGVIKSLARASETEK